MLVGRVRVDDTGVFAFAYDRSWLARDDRFPVSVTLPITGDEVVGGPAHAFFANLLPEGGARQGVCARLGISADNDFALLKAIGGECAGALSLLDPSRSSPDPAKYRYDELKADRLRELVSGDSIPLLFGGAETRLSLAGAQDKLPVAVFDGRLYLPANGAPSTHILKLPNDRYPHLPANEAFALTLAQILELDVVSATLFTRTNPPSLLVTRYDRVHADDVSPIQRLHQEDLCQATGLPPTRKYEIEGGPSFVGAVSLVRGHVSRPLVDVPRLIRWQAYNLVIGNSDGHAKNLSILYSAGGEARLAPFYDLVSTREYKGLSRNLAMRVAGRQNPDEVSRADWSELSKSLGIAERTALELVRDVAQRSLDSIELAKRAFREAYGKLAVLQTLPAATAKRARRILRSLAP